MGAERGSEPAVLAGSSAGLAALAVFLVIHHLWIVPIWFIAPVGAVMAVVGGAAAGASYEALRAHLPRRPWASAAVAAVFASTLVPAILVAQARGPMFAMDADGGGTLLVPPTDAVLDVLVGLIAVSAITGGVLGWLIGRSRRAAVTTMLAAVAFALGPGHNIPLLGDTSAVGMELAILGAVVVVASVVLVEAEAWFSRRHSDAP